MPPLDGRTPTEPPGGITKLPTEEEVDKALDYVERMFKKFRDRMQKFETATGGNRSQARRRRIPARYLGAITLVDVAGYVRVCFFNCSRCISRS